MTSTIAQNPSSASVQEEFHVPAIALSENVVLQLPLSKIVGASGGIIIILPSPDRIALNPIPATPSDFDPLIKWAQEGFAVVGVTNHDGLIVPETLKQGLDALQNLEQVNVRNKLAVIGEHSMHGIPVLTSSS